MFLLKICISILDSFKFLFGLSVKIKGRVRPLCCRCVYLAPPQVATCDVVVITQYTRKSVNFGVSPPRKGRFFYRTGPAVHRSADMDKLKTVLSGEETRRDDRTILEVKRRRQHSGVVEATTASEALKLIKLSVCRLSTKQPHWDGAPV